LLVIVGPTAVGKSKIALELAQELDGEIINADSVQVYKGLNIGSAKPSVAEQALVRYHLLNVCDPEQGMDAGRFVHLAEAALADIGRRGKQALLVGGTGLYIKSLLYGLAPIPAIDKSLRDELKREMEIYGLPHMRERLAALDAESWRRLHPADRQRILRALEVALQTGKPIAFFQAQHNATCRYTHLLWGIQTPQARLYEIIAQRAQQMWRQGLLAEVYALLQRGVNPQAPALQALGYRQALAVLEGKMEEREALAEMIKHTQAYAKRQMTWFSAMPGIKWIEARAWRNMVEPSRQFMAGLRR
jgi:tRNA dimethylallyltransferase